MRSDMREINNWSCIILDLDDSPTNKLPAVTLLRQYMSVIVITEVLEVRRDQVHAALKDRDIWHDGLYMRSGKDRDIAADILKFSLLAEVRAIGFNPQLAICARSLGIVWRNAGLPCLYL